MTGGSGEIWWPPRSANEKDLARIAPPEQVAELVAPTIAEAVRIFGELPSVPTLTAIIAEAIARSPVLQEFGLAEIDADDALAIAESVHLITSGEME